MALSKSGKSHHFQFPGHLLICLMSSIVTVLLLLTAPVFAGRPLVTEDSATTGKEKAQVEAGQSWIESQNGDKTSLQTYKLNLGLQDNLDLQIEKDGIFLIPIDGDFKRGASDSMISVKYRFIEGSEQKPSMGVRIFADLSDGHENLSSGRTECGTVFFMTKNFESIVVHANLGYVMADISQGISGEDIVIYAVAAEKPLSRKVRLVGEVFGNSSNASAGQIWIQSGITYDLSPSITLDAGYLKALGSDVEPRNNVTLGITINF